MVNKILPILLLSAACAFAAPTLKEQHGGVKATLKRPAKPAAIHEVYARDMSRWSNLASSSTGSSPLVNTDVSYTLSIGLGTPAQNVDLVFDTGSSDLWVMSANYNPSSSSTANDLGETWSVDYGVPGDETSAGGEEYTDVATIGSYSFTQELGVATTSQGMNGLVGIVGFGPDDLSAGTNTGENIPTPVDNLYSSGQIGSDVIGVYFQPITDGGSNEANGEVTFGGVDSSKYTGSITYVPITSKSPSNEYWGVDCSELAYGTTKLLGATAGIVDTGTTLILISSTAVKTLYKAIPGATLDSNSGLYKIPSSQVANLKNITFTIGGTAFTLTPAQYTVPANLVVAMGGTAGDTYTYIGDIGSSTTGQAFILGQKFLENYYSVFDTTNSRVGLATAAH
ncbi:hypothetical protein EMPS_00393 [Entomortierella parvispora]|uniref:Peptidase A1 domain-containing protein n=1 Tax=Entomortierella parvispora TaxID=205924 RepID=A0A9P3LRT7_9FUNG|nr:hypothetical protein EMPS_00393 [Entomortierella parvispora]